MTREKHESLDAAIAALREHTERIRAEGDLPEVSMIRTYEPGDQVKARLEISTGGVLRSRDAGIDVMGDGAPGPVPRRRLPQGARRPATATPTRRSRRRSPARRGVSERQRPRSRPLREGRQGGRPPGAGSRAAPSGRYTVFINGTEQVEGTDYEIGGGVVIFREPIIKEDLSELGAFRKVVLGLGLVGSYQKNEVVDVQYRIAGATHLASDLDGAARLTVSGRGRGPSRARTRPPSAHPTARSRSQPLELGDPVAASGRQP